MHRGIAACRFRYHYRTLFVGPSAVAILNAALDVARLGQQFSRSQRLQIHEVLETDAADRLYECLAHEVPWGLAYTDGKGPQQLEAGEISGFNHADWLDLIGKANIPIGERQFRFVYNRYDMVGAHEHGREPTLLLHPVLEFLNSAEFLGFIREVTGNSSVYSAWAEATRYLPGHFLTQHNDYKDGSRREIAYVLNLTRDWRADWGGLLQFTDEDGKVLETYMPAFNSLALFSVPMWHCVSYVAPFAPHGRYAIAGWGLKRAD